MLTLNNKPLARWQQKIINDFLSSLKSDFAREKTLGDKERLRAALDKWALKRLSAVRKFETVESQRRLIARFFNAQRPAGRPKGVSYSF